MVFINVWSFLVDLISFVYSALYLVVCARKKGYPLGADSGQKNEEALVKLGHLFLNFSPWLTKAPFLKGKINSYFLKRRFQA